MTNPAWTYSQLDTFESCPRKFYRTKVKRDVVDPPTVHTEWGTAVHTAFENFINDGTLLPTGMTQWQAIANKLAALPGEKLTEYKFALDRNFQPADWGAAWTRGIADLAVLRNSKAAIIDYKTGKPKPSQQLDLYAGYAFQHFPQVQQVTTGYIWLKEKVVHWKQIKREDAPAIWQALLPRINRLESAYERDKWPAVPSGLCRGWCPVHDCEFNNKKR